MSKIKKQKKTKPIGRIEFIFNVISLLAVIGIGIYFGVRSFYYYNVENFHIAQGNKTLNGTIINNTKVTDGEGLHHDKNGYYYKGKVSNNYVKSANRLFRIIRINKDGSVKVITDDIVTSFMWGEESNYNSSNLKKWLSTDNKLGVYYKTLPSPHNYLVKTEYSEDCLNNTKVIANKVKSKDYITTLTIEDYINANGKDSFLNNGHAFWILGQDDKKNNLYIDIDGSIQSAPSYEAYGLRAIMTLKKDLNIISGNGSLENPYLIKQSKGTNYVDNYIKLGNDTWKINYDDGITLKMYLTRTLDNIGSAYENLSNFFNYIYYPNLPYNSVINDTPFPIGEISEEFSYDYSNIYSNTIYYRVGMLNMFDYYSGGLDNFYLMNTTSSIGNMVYVYHSNGILEEVMSNEQQLSIPVISINKNLIKNGDGTINNPFTI